MTLTLAAGSVLVTGGSNTLSVPIVSTTNAGATFETNSGASLNVTGSLTGTGGLDYRVGRNADLLRAPDYLTGTNTINSGTVTLAGATMHCLSKPGACR